MISHYDASKPIDNISFFSAVKGTLEAGIEVRFTVTGMSMWPFLRAEETV